MKTRKGGSPQSQDPRSPERAVQAGGWVAGPECKVRDGRKLQPLRVGGVEET